MTILRTSGSAIAVEGADQVVGGPPAVCPHGSTVEIADKPAQLAALGIRRSTVRLYRLCLPCIEGSPPSSKPPTRRSSAWPNQVGVVS